MKTFWRIVAHILELLLAFAVLFLVFIRYDEHLYIHTNDYRLSPAEQQKIQEGDIILRAGFGYVSDRILSYLDERCPVSHCGIVDSTVDGWRVIHTVSSQISGIDGMQADPLGRFVKHSRPGSLIVVRPKGLDDNTKEEIANEARGYLAQKLPFDDGFDPYDHTSLYCTELIWLILRDVADLDIYHGAVSRGDYLPFACFTDTGSFDIIINHQR